MTTNTDRERALENDLRIVRMAVKHSRANPNTGLQALDRIEAALAPDEKKVVFVPRNAEVWETNGRVYISHNGDTQIFSKGSIVISNEQNYENWAPSALTTPQAVTGIPATQWQPIETAPRDGTEIETDMGLVFWSERPVCMLGTRNGGFPAGWATARGSGTDYNLPVDPPTKWKPITPPSTRGDT